jgi:outer membrane protein insertion porin family
VLVNRTPVVTGADTQLLGNFEYRVPIFGPVSVAGFADIGSAFNLRQGRDQLINSDFLPDDPFLRTIGQNLSTLALANNPTLALSGGGAAGARQPFCDAIRINASLE